MGKRIEQENGTEKTKLGFIIGSGTKCNDVVAGDVENEDEILEWLLAQLEKDEIEDVTDEMLDRLVKDGKTLAVLFCKIHYSHRLNLFCFVYALIEPFK